MVILEFPMSSVYPYSVTTLQFGKYSEWVLGLKFEPKLEKNIRKYFSLIYKINLNT